MGAFVSPAHNRAMGFVCNLHVGAPVFVPFKYYHQRHHTFQGYDGIDDDIPSLGECNVVVNTIAKAVWLFFQTEVYALRPLITTPKPFTKWDLIGWALCIAYDAALYTLVGPKALGYVLLSTHWGGSIHPIAGHFISEHYLDVLNEVEGLEEQETFSYYGPLNAITYNVGYHNEHHDFPQIPGSRLPQVRKIAPEFYQPLRETNLGLPHRSACGAVQSRQAPSQEGKEGLINPGGEECTFLWARRATAPPPPLPPMLVA